MKHLSFLILFISTILPAQDSAKFFKSADVFFNTYVESGEVKYAEINQNPKLLNDLLAEAKKVKITPLNEQEFKAFWINAYNLAVINGIIKNYPVDSPMDIDGFFDLQKHDIGQLSLTLDEIEHRMLFKNFPEEARFHFVLVCAAKSCPPIIADAYRPETLENQLQRQTEKALNDPEFVRIQNGRVLFSELLKWYKEDFTKNGKSLIEYVNLYRKSPIPNDLEIKFYDYNWELNNFAD